MAFESVISSELWRLNQLFYPSYGVTTNYFIRVIAFELKISLYLQYHKTI